MSLVWLDTDYTHLLFYTLAHLYCIHVSTISFHFKRLEAIDTGDVMVPNITVAQRCLLEPCNSHQVTRWQTPIDKEIVRTAAYTIYGEQRLTNYLNER